MDAIEHGPTTVRDTGKPLGAEVMGVDLARAIDAATFAAIERLFNDNGMIFFRGTNGRWATSLCGTTARRSTRRSSTTRCLSAA